MHAKLDRISMAFYVGLTNSPSRQLNVSNISITTIANALGLPEHVSVCIRHSCMLEY